MYYDDQIARVMGTPIKPNDEIPDPDDKMITRYNMPQGEKVNDLIKALNDVSGSKKIKMGGRTLLATIEKEVGEAIGRAGDMKDANNRIPLNVAERWLNLPNAQKMKKFTAAFEEKF